MKWNLPNVATAHALYVKSKPSTAGTKRLMDIDFPPKITCVRNLEFHFFKKGQCSIFRMFLKLFSAIILGVRNFRVFEILEHLP